MYKFGKLNKKEITLIYNISFKDKDKAKTNGLKWKNDLKKWCLIIYNENEILTKLEENKNFELNNIIGLNNFNEEILKFMKQ
jgi:hypothetical protein